MFDYDDIICPVCQHMGVLPNGGYDWICPECGYEGKYLIIKKVDNYI